MPNDRETVDLPRFSRNCKEFRKKNSVALYILIPDSKTMELRHREMLRVINPKRDEYYLIPRPLDRGDFHISYHRSGCFHWRHGQKLIVPLNREADFQRSFQDYIVMQSVHGWIAGYCVACGRSVERPSLKRMLEIAEPYFPIKGLGSETACDDIYERRHITQPNRISQHKNHVALYPLATGIVLAELNSAVGELQALNCTLLDDGKLMLFKRATMNRGCDFASMSIAEEDVRDTLAVFL